jgi:hypothetical protein
MRWASSGPFVDASPATIESTAVGADDAIRAAFAGAYLTHTPDGRRILEERAAAMPCLGCHMAPGVPRSTGRWSWSDRFHRRAFGTEGEALHGPSKRVLLSGFTCNITGTRVWKPSRRSPQARNPVGWLVSYLGRFRWVTLHSPSRLGQFSRATFSRMATLWRTAGRLCSGPRAGG